MSKKAAFTAILAPVRLTMEPTLSPPRTRPLGMATPAVNLSGSNSTARKEVPYSRLRMIL